MTKTSMYLSQPPPSDDYKIIKAPRATAATVTTSTLRARPAAPVDAAVAADEVALPLEVDAAEPALFPEVALEPEPAAADATADEAAAAVEEVEEPGAKFAVAILAAAL